LGQDLATLELEGGNQILPIPGANASEMAALVDRDDQFAIVLKIAGQTQKMRRIGKRLSVPLMRHWA
jgi:hypothetical protein